MTTRVFIVRQTWTDRVLKASWSETHVLLLTVHGWKDFSRVSLPLCSSMCVFPSEMFNWSWARTAHQNALSCQKHRWDDGSMTAFSTWRGLARKALCLRISVPPRRSVYSRQTPAFLKVGNAANIFSEQRRLFLEIQDADKGCGKLRVWRRLKWLNLPTEQLQQRFITWSTPPSSDWLVVWRINLPPVLSFKKPPFDSFSHVLRHKFNNYSLVQATWRPPMHTLPF